MNKEPELNQSTLAELAVPWTLPTPPRYVFTNANLVDPVKGEIVKNCTIHLHGGTVLSVSLQSTEWANDPNLIKIDLRGNYVCPGLTDCHVHIAAVPGETSLAAMKSTSPSTSLIRQPQLLRSMLERGFTTIRDCGGATFAMKKAVEQHVHPGPRMFIAGHFLSQTGGHGDMRQMSDEHECCAGTVLGMGRIVDGVPACLKFAREELRQGADFLKIMGGGGVASPTDKIEHVQFSDEEIKAIVTVATNAGTYVTTHAYTPQSIQQAVRQGVKGVEHGNLLDEPTAKVMAENDVFLTPTLITYATIAKFSDFLPPASIKKNTEVLEKGLQALKIAQDAGVSVCFGTDLLGLLHFNQSREFGLRNKVQTPLEIIRSATITPARMMKQEKTLGQVAPGFAADLLILTANPLEDITVLDEPEKNLLATLKDGRVVASRWSELKLDMKRLHKLA